MPELSLDQLNRRPLRAIAQIGSVDSYPRFEYEVPWNRDLSKIIDTLLGPEETLIVRSRTRKDATLQEAFGPFYQSVNLSSKHVTITFDSERASRPGPYSQKRTVKIRRGTATLENGDVVDPIVFADVRGHAGKPNFVATPTDYTRK